MPENDPTTYVWAIEWHNPFSEPSRGMIFHSLTLQPDIEAEDFETFMKEEAFPAIAGILTRAIVYGPQYLLKNVRADRGHDPLGSFQVEEMRKKLDTLCVHKVDNECLIVLAPESPGAEEGSAH